MTVSFAGDLSALAESAQRQAVEQYVLDVLRDGGLQLHWADGNIVDVGSDSQVSLAQDAGACSVVLFDRILTTAGITQVELLGQGVRPE